MRSHMCQHYRVRARCQQCLGIDASDAAAAAEAAATAARPLSTGTAKPGQGWRLSSSAILPEGAAERSSSAAAAGGGVKRKRAGWEMGEDAKAKAARARKADGVETDDAQASDPNNLRPPPPPLCVGDGEDKAISDKEMAPQQDKDTAVQQFELNKALAEIER